MSEIKSQIRQSNVEMAQTSARISSLKRQESLSQRRVMKMDQISTTIATSRQLYSDEKESRSNVKKQRETS
jgi:hypothetical protein